MGSPGDDDPDVLSSSGVDDDAPPTRDSFLAAVARIPARAATTLPLPRPGDTVGRFVVLRELGRGGMGVVYAAEDPALGREVALKVLVLQDEPRRRRFLREARAAAALGHAGAVAVYEVGEAEGRAFIAMELVRGASLRALLTRNPEGLPIAEARRIAKDLAHVLARAHERGLVHRDLKPENVMVAEDGRVKLLDFGLAKQTEGQGQELALASTTVTTEGSILGTPSYMSPEQAKGIPVDARSDVFSLGVMLYEMVAGRRPFEGHNMVQVFIAIDRDEPAPPSTLNPRVDPALERLVLRCLRKDPAARYADAGELLRDLERQASTPALTTTPETAPRPRPRRLLAMALGLGAAALAAVLTVLIPRPRLSPTLPSSSPTTLPAPLASQSASDLAPGVVPTAVTDLPTPPTASTSALAAYRAGLQAIRTGDDWGPDFERALALDPGLAAAEVQLAAVGMVMHTSGVREHFHKARDASARLSERDRGLLDAIEPVVLRQPADWAEADGRLARLLERFPGDAQLWHLLALGHANYDDFEASARMHRRAFTIDPGFSRAIADLSIDEAYLGRFEEAERSLDQCLVAKPGSARCLILRSQLQSYVGDCERMEHTARQVIAAGAPPYVAYPLLAEALASRGQPMATVREALRQMEKELDKLPAESAALRRRQAAHTAVQADLLEGDFDRALGHLRDLERIIANSAWLSDHSELSWLRAQILIEVGHAAEAGRVALDFLNRREAWEPDPSAEDIALAHDATPSLLLAALRGGVLSRAQVASRREAWLRGWSARATKVAQSYLWLHGWAGTVESPEDARAALGALPSYGSLPPYRPNTMIDVAVGATFLLGDRVDEALGYLDHAARRCTALSFPVEHTRAQLWLGRAREAHGDRSAACAAYRVVLGRWGHAHSVTADEARERSARLGCGS
jgi:serine/threonine-protein kinase